ncbi:MAG TPA: hypothetical protein VN711_03610 [Candidatus Saccharimonadales bacterium]|nr:hypothetical protein [Candidatus Saccharimonadales bacterium]
MKKSLFLLFFAFAFFPTVAFAKIGVGVATGKIVVTQKLKPGIIYNLPPLTVINTGDVPSDYEVAVTYFEKQSQLKPPNDWFIFTPKSFHLDPGKVQVVNVKVNLPLETTPGDYFGFLEAHPIQKDKAGLTTIGIAAAAKLYFTIVPANIFQAIYYKITSFWTIYSPWTNYTAIGILLIIVVSFFKKFFHIELHVKQKNDKQKSNLNE